MNELNNVVTAVGTYNDIKTTLTSNTSVVNIVDGLALTKDADKKNWIDGELTYTITISNNADKTYVKPVLTDIIDTNFVSFVEGSVMINGAKAEESQYNYDEGSHTLTINLNDILPSSSSYLTFHVTKKA